VGRDEAARPATWTYFYLFVILDIYSRYVVGWTVQHQERGNRRRLIAETLHKQKIARHQLTITLTAAQRCAPSQ